MDVDFGYGLLEPGEVFRFHVWEAFLQKLDLLISDGQTVDEIFSGGDSCADGVLSLERVFSEEDLECGGVLVGS